VFSIFASPSIIINVYILRFAENINTTRWQLLTVMCLTFLACHGVKYRPYGAEQQFYEFLYFPP
jgi:hypothetical protein